MANILSGFGGFDIFILLGKYALWFIAFLFIAFVITAAVIMLLVKKKQIKVIEIDVNKRIRIFNGRNKRKSRGSKIIQFWAGKIKRFLPMFQRRDVYVKNRQDTVILFKDNNGQYHPLRCPTWKQIKRWYQVVHGVDLEEKNEDGTYKYTDKVRSIYFAPTPHEDLDWLANQIVESDREFKDIAWWQHPSVLILGACAIAAFIQIINLVFLYLTNK